MTRNDKLMLGLLATWILNLCLTLVKTYYLTTP
jgi:hypothetical protein